MCILYFSCTLHFSVLWYLDSAFYLGGEGGLYDKWGSELNVMNSARNLLLGHLLQSVEFSMCDSEKRCYTVKYYSEHLLHVGFTFAFLFHNFVIMFIIIIISLTLYFILDLMLNKFFNLLLLKNHIIEII